MSAGTLLLGTPRHSSWSSEPPPCPHSKWVASPHWHSQLSAALWFGIRNSFSHCSLAFSLCPASPPASRPVPGAQVEAWRNHLHFVHSIFSERSQPGHIANKLNPSSCPPTPVPPSTDNTVRCTSVPILAVVVIIVSSGFVAEGARPPLAAPALQALQ